MTTLAQKLLSHDLWNISGNFGKYTADAFHSKNDLLEVNASYTEDNNHVFHYTGLLENLSQNALALNCLHAKFHLGSGEFEVYTQYNGWQNENTGAWQPLVSEVRVSSDTIRTAYGAAPFMALRNKQTGRGVVFHLVCDYAWSIGVKLVPQNGEVAVAELEIGLNSENLFLDVPAGEKVPTPEVIFYEFTNQVDLDCAKLHKFCLANYKRKEMPVIYNTWLANFDNINVDFVCAQIPKAAAIGCEYFVIDAGWFGKGDDWYSCRGDWKEQASGKLQGKVFEISEKVRHSGMKFGLWFEIESANKKADAIQLHPEDYFTPNGNMYFLDFSNEQARQRILEVLSENIKKYQIEFIKFDFNQDVHCDAKKSAFTAYYRGYELFLASLKERFPNIYLENCASGGMRIDLKNASRFDSFWLSDNQSPYEGMRIFKEGIKRLPPQCIEKWAVLTSLENFFPTYASTEKEKILSTHDATWDSIVGVHESFLKGFLSGSPIGISCDLTRISDSLTEILRQHIAEFKESRSFWESAVCSILADTEKILVLQYETDTQIRILAFSYKTMQHKLTVYPKVDIGAAYLIENERIPGDELTQNGIELNISGNYRTAFLQLEKAARN